MLYVEISCSVPILLRVIIIVIDHIPFSAYTATWMNKWMDNVRGERLRCFWRQEHRIDYLADHGKGSSNLTLTLVLLFRHLCTSVSPAIYSSSLFLIAGAPCDLIL